MSKAVKKDFLQLKFDTSTDKLACFIKNKPKSNDSDNNDKATRNIRKKNKSYKQKAAHFQNDAFLQSILSNVFTEQFDDPQEIKKLVNDSKIADQQQASQQQQYSQVLSRKKTRYLQLGAQEQILTPQYLCNKETQCKLLMEGWKNDHQHMSSTRVGTEQTPQHSFIQEKLQITQSFSTQLQQTYSQINRVQFQAPYTQCYPYYAYQPIERKKRTVTNEQALQFKIDLNNLENDCRTTLMIRNIPNKYSQQLLLEELKNYRVKFDFFYLPIDYNNACNVGYAFINFIHNKFIVDFYQQFNGRRWSRFNSQKICSLAYARIQGTSALRNHFRNSHVMQQKDKRFRPLLTNELDDDKRNNLSRIIENQRQKI